MFLFFSKKGLGCLLAAALICGSASAGSWQEKTMVPAEYEKIEYASNGKLFWLHQPKEKNPSRYFHTQEGFKALPDGLVRGEGDGIRYDFYAYDGYENNDKSTLMIRVAEKDKKSRQGLVDLTGNVVVPTGDYKGFYLYRDGYTMLDDTLYKDGQQTTTMKGIWRRTAFPDAWSANNNSAILYNHKGEKIMDLPFVEKEWVSITPDMIIGKSNGKDGKPKAYRAWNLKLEEITPTTTGFKDILLLNTATPREGMTTNQIYGFFGRTEVGWSVYPYLGNGKFGEPIKIDAKEKEYSSCSEVAPGYYRLGRPQEDGDYLLDINGKTVRRDANGIDVKTGTLTQEKWRIDKFFMPFIIGGSSFYFATGGMVTADGGHFVRLRKPDGKEFATLWDYVYLGNNYIVNRKDGQTRILTYTGEVVMNFATSEQGYLPLSGKEDTLPEEEDGKPGGFTDVDFSNWPGKGRYQPYYQNGDWGILDLETATDLVAPSFRYGKIVAVSDDGKQFWSYFDQGSKLKGIKQFDWTE